MEGLHELLVGNLEIVRVYIFHGSLDVLPLPCFRLFEELDELCAFNLLSLAGVYYLLLHTICCFPSLFLHGHHTLLELTFSQNDRKRYLILFTCRKLRGQFWLILGCEIGLHISRMSARVW